MARSNHGEIRKAIREKGGERTNEELLAASNAEQKWRPHGRESLRRLETMGDQPATSLALINERALGWRWLSYCPAEGQEESPNYGRIATLRRGWGRDCQQCLSSMLEALSSVLSATRYDVHTCNLGTQEVEAGGSDVQSCIWNLRLAQRKDGREGKRGKRKEGGEEGRESEGRGEEGKEGKKKDPESIYQFANHFISSASPQVSTLPPNLLSCCLQKGKLRLRRHWSVLLQLMAEAGEARSSLSSPVGSYLVLLPPSSLEPRAPPHFLSNAMSSFFGIIAGSNCGHAV